MKASYLVPVVTIFNEDMTINEAANIRLWNMLIDNGLDGIVLMGSTGEFSQMTMAQKKQIIALAGKEIAGRTRLIVGTGCENLEDTVELSNFAADCGAEAVIVLTPYYFFLEQKNIEAFYDAVVERIHLPMFLYNYPDRTNHDVAPDTVYNLLKKHYPKIKGYKDSVGAPAHTRELIAKVKPEFPEFEIFCGMDENFAANCLGGGDGVVGALANIDPALSFAMKSALEKEDFAEVAKLQKRFNHMVRIFDVTKPYMPAVKTAMVLNGFEMSDVCLCPFGRSDEAQTARIAELLGK